MVKTRCLSSENDAQSPFKWENFMHFLIIPRTFKLSQPFMKWKFKTFCMIFEKLWLERFTWNCSTKKTFAVNHSLNIFVHFLSLHERLFPVCSFTYSYSQCFWPVHYELSSIWFASLNSGEFELLPLGWQPQEKPSSVGFSIL